MSELEKPKSPEAPAGDPIAAMRQALPPKLLGAGGAPAPAPRKAKPEKPAAPPIADAAAPPPIDASAAKPKRKRKSQEAGAARGDDPPPEDRAGEHETPPECPVRALGRVEGMFHFLTKAGEVLSFRAKDLAAANIAALFDGDTEWLRKVFPEWGRRSADEIREAEAAGRTAPSFRVSAARDFFMRECAERGVRDPHALLRGPGAWRARNGDLILHLGDEIRRVAADGGGETVFAAGCEIDGRIYAAAPPEPKPADIAATPEEVAGLHALLARWRWRAPAEAPRLLLGWVCAGFLTGALSWRPHIYVTGDSGDGKSTFERLLASLYGARAERAADPSGAFVRQVLRGSARPVLVDEIENKDVGRRADDVIETARLASSDDQAATGRGSAGGQAQKFGLVGAFYFSSILHPPMKPQDLTRVTVFDLEPLGDDPDGTKRAAIALALSRAGEFGAKLQRRLIACWPKIEAARRIYETAIGKLGRKARVADQFGTMLALAHLALDTDPLTQAWVDKFVAGLDLGDFVDRDEAESESQACVTRLLTFAADSWAGGTRRTLAALIADIGNENLGDDHRLNCGRTIQAYGLRVEKDLLSEAQASDAPEKPPPGPWLVVAHQFDGLDQVFKGTRWERGVWNQALRRVPGAKLNAKRAVRMAGVARKGVWLPLKPILSGAAWEGDGKGAKDGAPPEPPDVTGEGKAGYGAVTPGGYGSSDWQKTDFDPP